MKNTQVGTKQIDENNAELKRLMIVAGFNPGKKQDRINAAAIMDISIYTIDSWLKSPQSVSFRSMPNNLLELFKLKTAKG